MKNGYALSYGFELALTSLSLVLAGCGGASPEGDLGTSSSAVAAGGTCSEGDGYCTATLQCENHHWVDRYDDPAACTSGPGASDYCSEGDGYCTSTSQCEDHHWVDRYDDPAACTSGPGAKPSDYCSEGDGYCTATSQCESHHWVDRYDDPASCTSGPGAGGGGSGGTSAADEIAYLDGLGYYGANLVHLGQFLVAHGYSKAGAAGIAGCVAGESIGNPEDVGTGGGGLIGWTPLSTIYTYGGTIGGNSATDLANQFRAILNYNDDNDPDSIGTLNAYTNPVSAADFYSQVFERPLVTDSDVRSDVAYAVYSAIGG
jgi:hypothetical protein